MDQARGRFIESFLIRG